jgi:nanoRNase/pAp phosphatase (c-di-AMP/oligoRNAs hydrolase)
MSTASKKYRLLTRSDFDGLVCAILLKEMNILGDTKFVHPKDVQDGNVDVTNNDILTNLPYVGECHLCFDHHASEEIRNEGEAAENHILRTGIDSAARVVFDYYGGTEQFSGISEEMMAAVDKADSAKFDDDDILNPQGWVLLSFLMDARTGLGRFHDFRVPNYVLMMDLIENCRDHNIDEILALPDVQERVNIYLQHSDQAVEQIRRCSTVYDNLVVLDLRDEKTIFATNRFMIYSLFPECNISIHVLWGKQKQNTVFTIGKSILDRSCATDIGELCLEYGGGGHPAAGTCQVQHEDAERSLGEIIARIHCDAGVGTIPAPA